MTIDISALTNGGQPDLRRRCGMGEWITENLDPGSNETILASCAGQYVSNAGDKSTIASTYRMLVSKGFMGSRAALERHFHHVGRWPSL